MSNNETAMTKSMLPVRGYLLHITHYDPMWCKNKDHEEPFDLDVAKQVVDAMAEANLNLLLVDTKDGLRYRSHPELARPYSRPIETLSALRDYAESKGIETALKLNFSQSGVHRHNHWFRPYNDLFDNDEYWRRAFQIIDELIEAARPPRFFHIGMDEDHWRGLRLYVAAIERLRAGLAERGLRTLIWNDSACGWPQAEVHKEKSLAAEREADRRVIHVLWDYGDVQPGILQRLRREGFDVWGAPGTRPEHVSRMRDALLACGGMGILLTRWKPCIPANRDDLVGHVRAVGPLCLGDP